MRTYSSRSTLSFAFAAEFNFVVAVVPGVEGIFPPLPDMTANLMAVSVGLTATVNLVKAYSMAKYW